jgi:hypothetical protein
MGSKAVAFLWQEDLRISLWFASFARRSDEIMPLKVVALVASLFAGSIPRVAPSSGL